MDTTMEKPGKYASPTSVRVTSTCMNLWNELAKQQGLSRTAYLETTIRKLAKQEGIEANEDTSNG